MSLSEMAAAIAAFVAVVTLLVGLFKWFVGWAEKRHETHDKRAAELINDLERVIERIERNEQDIRDTRDALHRDYVRQDAMDEFRKEMARNSEKIHERLSGMSRDLNQLIGLMGKRNEQP